MLAKGSSWADLEYKAVSDNNFPIQKYSLQKMIITMQIIAEKRNMKS